jgi:hypothetical protein
MSLSLPNAQFTHDRMPAVACVRISAEGHRHKSVSRKTAAITATAISLRQPEVAFRAGGDWGLESCVGMASHRLMATAGLVALWSHNFIAESSNHPSPPGTIFRMTLPKR